MIRQISLNLLSSLFKLPNLRFCLLKIVNRLSLTLYLNLGVTSNGEHQILLFITVFWYLIFNKNVT